MGYVSLSLRTDTAFATTKAGNLEDVNEYIIQILQGQTVINQFTYAERPDELKLDAGTYTASATWGSDVAAAFDALYMEGSSEFVIKEDMTTTIELAPTPANAKVVVDFSSELGEVYDDYYIDMTTGQTGDTPLVYKKDETRPAYFAAASTGEKLNLAMMFQANDTKYQFDRSLIINPRDFVTLKLKLGEESEGAVTPTITSDITSLVFPAAALTTQEISVTTNCEDFTVTKSDSWFTVEKGTNKITVSLASPNTTNSLRTGSITLTATSGNKTAVAVVAVAQATTAGSGAYVYCLEGYSFKNRKLTVRTTGNTLDQDNASKAWVDIETASDNQISINTLSENTSENAREAAVGITGTYEGNEITDSLKVTQLTDMGSPVISVYQGIESVSKLNFIQAGGSETLIVKIENASEWEFVVPEDDKGWLSVSELTDGKITVVATALGSNEARSTVLTIVASNESNKISYYNIYISQGAVKPILNVTITVNREVEGTYPLTGYEVDNPLSEMNDPQITCSGFSSGETITIERGKASSYFLNLRVPNGIKTFILRGYGSGEVDLINGGNPYLICTPNQTNTLATLYLDSFLNSLNAGSSHNLQWIVTDNNSKQAIVYLSVNVNN
ncbi:MAG: DUF4493 domain-containing protein [Tannerellaceae bacterium]|nr:DUF4493 domain-containing protein [Tannerellaceae bacterium]